jgi:hypothetical protein
MLKTRIHEKRFGWSVFGIGNNSTAVQGGIAFAKG